MNFLTPLFIYRLLVILSSGLHHLKLHGVDSCDTQAMCIFNNSYILTLNLCVTSHENVEI